MAGAYAATHTGFVVFEIGKEVQISLMRGERNSKTILGATKQAKLAGSTEGIVYLGLEPFFAGDSHGNLAGIGEHGILCARSSAYSAIDAELWVNNMQFFALSRYSIHRAVHCASATSYTGAGDAKCHLSPSLPKLNSMPLSIPSALCQPNAVARAQ